MTIAIYNGVTINSVQVTSVRTEPVLDESNVVVQGLRTTIELSGIIHASTAANLATEAQAVRGALMRPRRRLRITVGGSDWVDVFGAGQDDAGEVDTDNGPIPLASDVTEIFGSASAIVSFSVSFTRLPSDTVGPVVVGHRWDQSFEVDEKNMTRRTVRGELKVSTAFAPSDLVNPDAYRGLVYPAYLPGFRRVSTRFAVNRSGTRIDYEIVDQEEFRPYPGQALVGSGSYSARLSGSKVTKSFAIELRGAKGTPPGSLLAAAVIAMGNRINLAAGASGDIITSAEVREDLFSNRVALSVQAVSPSALSTNIIPASYNFFTDLETTPGVAFNQPTPYGSALIRAAMTPIFDPQQDGVPDLSEPPGLDTAEVEQVTAASTSSQTLTVQAPDDSFTPDDTDIGGGQSSDLNDTQGGETFHTDIQQTVVAQIDNGITLLESASLDEATVVQQTRPPTIRFRHAGRLERMGTAPEPPTPNVPAGHLVEGYRVAPLAPRLAANKATQIYALEYAFDVVVPFDPARTDLFSDVTVSGFGTLARAGGTLGLSIDAPESKELSLDANGTTVATVVPVGWTLA